MKEQCIKSKSIRKHEYKYILIIALCAGSDDTMLGHRHPTLVSPPPPLVEDPLGLPRNPGRPGNTRCHLHTKEMDQQHVGKKINNI